jgi:D-tyrosyl-tRNA(Tyr) deacylase
MIKGMKVVIQRVLKSAVTVNNSVVGQIDKGLCILVGIASSDTEKDLDWMAQKITTLRIFEDEAGKMNLSIKDINGSALIVSQFTLLADCNTGRRPSFTGAGDPKHAERLYHLFLTKVSALGIPTEHGIFGADMRVDIVNDGPATFILESPHS